MRASGRTWSRRTRARAGPPAPGRPIPRCGRPRTCRRYRSFRSRGPTRAGSCGSIRRRRARRSTRRNPTSPCSRARERQPPGRRCRAGAASSSYRPLSVPEPESLHRSSHLPEMSGRFFTRLMRTTSVEKLQAQEHRGSLRRVLGSRDLISIGLGTMIGGGIFTTIGTGVQRRRSGRSSSPSCSPGSPRSSRHCATPSSARWCRSREAPTPTRTRRSANSSPGSSASRPDPRVRHQRGAGRVSSSPHRVQDAAHQIAHRLVLPSWAQTVAPRDHTGRGGRSGARSRASRSRRRRRALRARPQRAARRRHSRVGDLQQHLRGREDLGAGRVRDRGPVRCSMPANLTTSTPLGSGR